MRHTRKRMGMASSLRSTLPATFTALTLCGCPVRRNTYITVLENKMAQQQQSQNVTCVVQLVVKCMHIHTAYPNILAVKKFGYWQNFKLAVIVMIVCVTYYGV